MNDLRGIIEQEIHDRGPIPFSRYMELCLYHLEFGYYSRNAEQFGKAGDFFTSSDVHAVFGRLLARQFEEMWRMLGSPQPFIVKELGPGRGLFARDLLDWSEKKFPAFFDTLQYVLVEASPALRRHSETILQRHLTSGKTCHASQEAQTPHIVFANEFFDAIPVEIVSSQGSLRIDRHHSRFMETWAPASGEELEFLDRFSVHAEAGERIEAPLQSQIAMTTHCDIASGFVVVIDYGYTREEQLAGRHRGTLKAIRQHSVSANAYEAPGEQDITADVNFTALAAAAERQGVHTQKLITQSQFLMGIGQENQFADAFEECRLPQERTKVALQLKHLVTPAGMGESFHVLVGSKGLPPEQVSRLAGLSFGRQGSSADIF